MIFDLETAYVGSANLTGAGIGMKSNLVLRITYRGFEKEKSHTFNVEPHCIKMFQRRWYLLARSPYHDKVLLYGIDRIENLSITKETFKLPKDFNAEEYFSTFLASFLMKMCQCNASY